MRPRLVSYRFPQKRCAFGYDSVAVLETGDDLNLLAARGSNDDGPQRVLASGGRNIDLRDITVVQNSFDWHEDACGRWASDAERSEHRGLQAVAWIRQYNTNLHCVRCGIERVADVGDRAVEGLSGVSGEEHIHGTMQGHSAEVVFEEITGDPDSVQIGHGGDGVRRLQRTLHLSAC